MAGGNEQQPKLAARWRPLGGGGGSIGGGAGKAAAGPPIAFGCFPALTASLQ